eukprot:10201337-Prorocentrum_lima.AAC.1
MAPGLPVSHARQVPGVKFAIRSHCAFEKSRMARTSSQRRHWAVGRLASAMAAQSIHSPASRRRSREAPS